MTRSPELCWLPKCNSMRTRPGLVEPEVYFRIVHVAGDGHHGAPVAPYREQTVEIALGPKGAFENGNISALTRRALPNQLINAVHLAGVIPNRPRKQRLHGCRIPPKSCRVESSPGIREGRQSGRYRPPGGHHPSPGDAGHGDATTRPGNPATNTFHDRNWPVASSLATARRLRRDRVQWRSPRSRIGNPKPSCMSACRCDHLTPGLILPRVSDRTRGEQWEARETESPFTSRPH